MKQLNHPSDSTSMCCATNRTVSSGSALDNGAPADICLENGLCLNIWQTTNDGSTIENRLYFRDFCTSADWTADGGSCLNVCTQETVRSR
jgi:hypothetical protein